MKMKNINETTRAKVSVFVYVCVYVCVYLSYDFNGIVYNIHAVLVSNIDLYQYLEFSSRTLARCLSGKQLS